MSDGGFVVSTGVGDASVIGCVSSSTGVASMEAVSAILAGGMTCIATVVSIVIFELAEKFKYLREREPKCLADLLRTVDWISRIVWLSAVVR